MLVLYIIIAVMAVIIIMLISYLIFQNKKREVEIYIRDKETNEKISGDIFIYDNKEIAKINMEQKQPVIKLPRGNQNIRIVNNDYYQKDEQISLKANPVVILLEKKKYDLTPLPITGCTPWNGLFLTDGEKSNECIVNSKGELPDAAGFFHTGLNILKRKTLVLFFSNTAQSTFFEKRMVKLEYSNGVVAYPVNGIMIENDYLIAEDTLTEKGTEYIIPKDFAGRLNFVFFRANLKDLKISAFFR